ncbi:MAG TPA: PKD domain-containing protein [Sediminibacterium sp.]|nr:PKD domain-containing protein [Sediminibacterium sp.]
MRKWLMIAGWMACCLPVLARHIAGGELYYEYLKPGTISGTSSYRITLRLFRDCSSTGPLLENEVVDVGIYNNADGRLQGDLSLPRVGPINTISLNTALFPCLIGDVSVCYQVAVFQNTVQLADNQAGYTLSRIGCCRVDNISNLYTKTNVGSNYVTYIPGMDALPQGHNSSPQFNVKDTALVCSLKHFTLDFGAKDPDNDSLSFEFCDAFTANAASNNVPPTPSLSLIPLPYAAPYSGPSPLGAGVTIDPATGIISGTAPPEGQYVVNVCIEEWRNGKQISRHRKDFILKVRNCDIIEADLPDRTIQCKDTVVHFENGSTSSAITSYLWHFGDGSSNFSTDPTVNYHYTDPGTYVASLTVTGPNGCVGSDSTLVSYYPGFTVDFKVSGTCYLNPYQFTDQSFARYGTINSWRWNFGESGSLADTSRLPNPVYTYHQAASTQVQLIAGSDKGCLDTLQKELVIAEKPVLLLPFHDTLICSIDTLAIPLGNSSGTISWQPLSNILYPDSGRPLVYPKDTTRYIATLTDNGCSNQDTVTVNVLQFIQVDLGADSTVCQSDTFRLHPLSQALSYRWSSSSGEQPASVKYPLVRPLQSTRYYVIANLGKCQALDSVFMKAVPYPVAVARPDTTICFGSRIQLDARITGSSVTWSPAVSLLNPNSVRPIAGPSATTNYIVRVTDTLGCPKVVEDSVLITVAPIVKADAGRDTVTLPNQPLQLQASGGIYYNWRPETGLDNPAIANPVATLTDAFDSIEYRVRVADAYGCYGEDAIVVRIFKSAANIFVPSAFTPNGDGKNDLLRPLGVGIAELHYFRVFNRWGQLVFTGNDFQKGWDGTLNGVRQPAGTYVFVTEGKDYQGKLILRKGTVVLIR